VIMGLDAWDNFSDNADVKARLDNRNTQGAVMAPGAQTQEGGIFRGTIDNFNIFTYAGWYVDPADDAEKEIFPAGEVVLTSGAIEGVRAFGAILEGKKLKAFRTIPKTGKRTIPRSSG
jgi:hypothetical protein